MISPTEAVNSGTGTVVVAGGAAVIVGSAAEVSTPIVPGEVGATLDEVTGVSVGPAVDVLMAARSDRAPHATTPASVSSDDAARTTKRLSTAWTR